MVECGGMREMRERCDVNAGVGGEESLQSEGGLYNYKK